MGIRYRCVAVLLGLLAASVAMPALAQQPLSTSGWGEQKIANPALNTNPTFGGAIAVDGDSAFIGAPYTTLEGLNARGTVHPYTFEGGIWVADDFLVGDLAGANARFGTSVSISGNTAVVGAPGTQVGGQNNHGAVYVFERVDSDWVQAAYLVADEPTPGGSFGQAVALDGDRLLVGAPSHGQPDISQTGVMFVFERDGEDWNQVARLVADDATANFRIGGALALSGSRVVVGAPMATVAGISRRGATYVFEDTGSGWAQTAKILASDGVANQQFGESVQVSGDRIAVGASRSAVDGSNFAGSAYILDWDGSDWIETAKIIADDAGFNQNFAKSIALDGDRLISSSPQASANGIQYAGAVYVHELQGTSWQQVEKLYASDVAENDYLQYGVNVALSGARVAVSATGAPLPDNLTGAVYMYVPEDEIAYVVKPLVTAGLGGFDPEGPQVVMSGESIEIQLLPQPGYHVASVDGDCPGEVDNDAFTAGPVTENCQIEVAFAINAPTDATVLSGGSQSTTVNHPFANALTAQFTNDAALPVPDIEVTITAPAVGAGVQVVSLATTDQDGTVTLPATANSVAGTYEVSVSVAGVAVPAVFELTNLPDAPGQLRVIAGNLQGTSVGSVFAEPLSVQLLDGWNNPITDAAVEFQAPAGDPTATLSLENPVTDAAGIAKTIATAAAEPGTYTVTASSGGLPAVEFTLSNVSADISLSVGIDNGDDYARYGEALNYLVTISNTGSEMAMGVVIDVPLSAQFEVSHAHWICFDAAMGHCTPSGGGPLHDSAITVPAQSSVRYLLSVPVAAQAQGNEITADAVVTGPNITGSISAADVDQLVLFRHDFEVPGLWLGGSPLETDLLASAKPDYFVLPAAPEDAPMLHVALGAREGAFRLERLDVDGRTYLRLVARADMGIDRMTRWLGVDEGGLLGIDVTTEQGVTSVWMAAGQEVVQIPIQLLGESLTVEHALMPEG